MRRSAGLTMLTMLAVLAAPRQADATHIDATTWSLAGVRRVRVRRVKAAPIEVTEHSMSFGADSRFTSIGVAFDLAGAFADAGRRGFKAAPDEASLAALRDRIISELEFSGDLSSATVRDVTAKIKGSASKDGTTLRVRCKLKMTLELVVDGRTLSLKAIVADKLSGVRAI